MNKYGVFERYMLLCISLYTYVALLRKYNILNMKTDGLTIGDTLYTYFKYVVLYDSDICTVLMSLIRISRMLDVVWSYIDYRAQVSRRPLNKEAVWSTDYPSDLQF